MSIASLLGATKPILRTFPGRGLLATALLLAAAPLAWGWAPPAEPGADYLFLDPSERSLAVQPLTGSTSGLGERVSYRAFNGNVYELTRFRGRYVDVLLPDSWIGASALSESQIRSFVDRSDLVYRQLMDLEGTEPSGEGPLVIAVIPDTCGWGCGLIGSKGIEIADIPSLNPTLWAEIAAGKGVGVLIHEMTHNFDVFWSYLYYLPGHPHAWTDFVNLYYFVYTQEGQVGATPEEVAQDWLATTAPYFNDRTATWKRCVRDGLCEARGITANNAWGGFGFRLSLLHGPQSVRRFMTFLRTYRQLTSARRVRFEICSRPDFQGWFFLYDSQGASRDFLYIGEKQCSRAAWVLPAGWSRFDITLNAASKPGSYAVESHSTSPWPAPPRVRTAPPQREGDHFLLTAAVISPGNLPSRPTAVRFWVSGQGIVGSVPYAPSVALAWTPPEGIDIGELTYRVLLVAQGVPLFDFTAAQAFAP